MPEDFDDSESVPPEEMDLFFDHLEPRRRRTDRHNNNSAFLGLVSFVEPLLNHFDFVRPLPKGSASWRDPQDRNRTIWKLNFYSDGDWLFGVRRSIARNCGRLKAMGALTTRFEVQGVEFVGFTVADDADSKAEMAKLVEAVREDDDACDVVAAKFPPRPTILGDFFRMSFDPDYLVKSRDSLSVYSRHGQQITGGTVDEWLDNWLRLAPPARGAGHWRDGFSAKEAARAWFPGNLAPNQMPNGISEALAQLGFSPSFAIVEFRAELDGYTGNSRNHDMILMGITSEDQTRCLVAIEVKAVESFGNLISKELLDGQSNDGSNKPARIKRLIKSLFGSESPDYTNLRYQLLHAIGSTLIEARRFECGKAVFLVHEFRSLDCSQASINRNETDYLQFVRALTGNPTLEIEPGKLVGPFHVPGDQPGAVTENFLPGSIPIYFGKVATILGDKRTK